MAGFHDLPDELLLAIIPYVALSAILPFSLTNKHIHELCRPVLLESQALHRKWGRVSLRLAWTEDMVMFLDTLFRDPRIAWYIRKFSTSNSDADDWAFNAFGIDADYQNMQVSVPHLQSRILSSPHLDDASRKEWRDALGSQAIMLEWYPPATLLLSLLPELHTLILPSEGEVILPWLRTSPLGSKLKKLHFAKSSRHTTVNEVLQALQLPSLTELIAPGTKSSETMRLSPPPPRVALCPLTRLDLRLTVLSPRDLLEILKRIKREGPHGGLQTFIYSHREVGATSTCAVFNGPAFAMVLLKYCRQSLIELDLDVMTSHYKHLRELNKAHPFQIQRDISALGRRLKGFERLEILKVSIEMLVEEWGISDEESDDDEKDEEEEEDAGSEDGGINLEAQIPLCEVLPLNLQVLHICCKGYMQSVAVVTEKLVALLKSGSDTVPRLRELRIDWQLFEPWKELLEGYCKNRGVRFEYER
jgi:hypothetical protein